MAVDIYDSQYLLILAPSLVIALMFLFFWLFMKETSYDEVLAKQKRDLKLPPSKPDTRKKNEKKKSKKKESASSGGGGGGGGESEEDLRDFDVTDSGNGPALEVEEEPVPIVARDETPLTTSAYVPVSVTPEAPTGLRERKKKEKKAARAAAAAAAAAAVATTAATEAAAANDNTSEEPEVNGSKSVSPKAEQPQAVSTLASPPSVHLEVQVQVQTAQAPPQALTPPVSSKKKEKKKQKAEAGEQSVKLSVQYQLHYELISHEMLFSLFLLADNQQPEPKVEQAPPPVKKESVIVAETKVLDGSTPTPPPTSGKKKNSAKKQKTEPGIDYSVVHDKNIFMLLYRIPQLLPCNENFLLKSSGGTTNSAWLGTFCQPSDSTQR